MLSPENHPTTIFKDTMAPDFVVKLTEDLKNSLDKVDAFGDFYMLLAHNSPSMTRFYCQLQEGKIYLSMTNMSKIFAFVEVNYSRIKLMPSKSVLGRQYAAIRFVKGSQYEEIYHENANVIKDWFETLKKY